MISIYPNPSSGKLFVCGAEGCWRLRVFDQDGEEVFSVSPSPEHSIINLSSQPEGVYFVAAYTKRGLFSRKVVLER